MNSIEEKEVKQEIARQIAHFLIPEKDEKISAELVIQTEGGTSRISLDLNKVYGKTVHEKEVWL